MGRTAAERLQMVHEASILGWLLSGRPLPVHDRRAIPGRVARLHTAARAPNNGV